MIPSEDTVVQFWLYQHLYSILHFIILFLFVGHLLRQRKPPSGTLAWFLFVLFLPYLGLLFYVVFGSRKYRSRKPQLYKRPEGAQARAHDLVQATLTAAGCAEPTANARVDFLETGEHAFYTLLELIRGAERSINVETYIFSNDSVGDLIMSELAVAARRGVRVRVLLDSLGARLPGHPSFSELEDSGGEMAKFMPLLHRPFRGRANLRNHRKLILIDGHHAMIGGMNLASEYMGPEPDEKRWVDLAVTVEGPVVEELGRIFELDWAFARGEKAEASQVPVKPRLGSEHVAQIVTSGPDVSSDPIYEALLTMIYGAKKRIWIATPYFVPDESLSKAMELAARRGVDVRLLIPRKSNHILADLGRGTYLRQVVGAGAKPYLFPRMLHAKATLIDDHYAMIGSANMDGRSLLLNYELGLNFYSPSEIDRVRTWFDKWLAKCEVGLPEPSWFDPWVEGLARMLGPLL